LPRLESQIATIKLEEDDGGFRVESFEAISVSDLPIHSIEKIREFRSSLNIDPSEIACMAEFHLGSMTKGILIGYVLAYEGIQAKAAKDYKFQSVCVAKLNREF
jgi:hypothetical protein